MKFKVNKHVSYSIEVNERSYPTLFNPAEHFDPTVVNVDDNTIVIGYLSHDEFCDNPVDGKIIDRRNRNREDEERCLNAIKTKDPYAVFLDVYSHSGDAWSISGEGMQCVWDTSRGAGLWVPDSDIIEGIEHKVVKELSEKMGEKFIEEYRKAELRYKVDAFIKAAKALGVETEVREIRSRIVLQRAKTIVSIYNSWISGDCWGVCCETIQNNDTIKDDAVWGFVGSDFAREELALSVKSMVSGMETLKL